METQATQKVYTHTELLIALLEQVDHVDKAREVYYSAKTTAEKNDALSELHRQQRRLADGKGNIQRLLQLTAPIDTAAAQHLLDEMTAAQAGQLRLFARQVLTMLEAQQTYFKLSNTGYTKEKSDALDTAKDLEKSVRTASKTILNGTLAQQSQLF